jgi:tetratricopeptide (TPR) repeat protein
VIPLLLALAAPAATVADTPEAELRRCTQQIRTAPEQALAAAERWRAKGGGLPARQCLGLAYSALERWPAAAAAFEEAAQEAEKKRDAGRADLWVQAGNGWLAAADPARARKAFDAALATGLLPNELNGEVHLDRARAAVALGDLAGARADIDKGLVLVPADPFAWYLSAALARRQDDIARAQSDIAKAVKLAPDDASILLEAGNVAGVSGESEAAVGLYARAARAAPNSPAGRAAQAALAANAAPVGSPPRRPVPVEGR